MSAILITGCSQGLGRALASSFAEENLNVYAVSRNQKLLSDLAKSSKKITTIGADVTTQEGRDSIYESISKEKQISIIHNAAIVKPVAITDLSENILKIHFETNFFAPCLINQKLFPLLKDNSRILNISSAAAELALPGLMQYCTSKAALELMTACFNAELNSQNIYFANLRPGMMDSGMQELLRNSNIKDLPGKNYYVDVKNNNQLIKAEVAARFVNWVMLKTDNSVFSNTLWNIYDKSYQHEWLGQSSLV